jgi:hypothetical protein
MTKKLQIVCAVLLASTVVCPTAARTEPQNAINCTLRRSGPEFKGSCEIPCQVNAFLAVTVLGAEAKADCTAPPRQRAAVLRKTEKGDGWLGTMEGLHPEDPSRFEVVDGTNAAARVAKTPFGWFALRSIKADGDALTLAIAIDKLLPPTADDIRIIQRARELLSDVKVWNKNDDRNCPPDLQQWSLFCALMRATTEVSGGIHYRQPALYAVREVLNEVGGSRVHKHRLKDYNNHPDTTLEDIHNLLRTAQSRLEKHLR